MKINNVTGMVGAYQQNTTRKVAAAKESSRPERADEVTLSKEAQIVLSLKEKVGMAADVRMGRIEELRRQIEAGTYRPSSRDIAAKMLNTKVFEDLL